MTLDLEVIAPSVTNLYNRCIEAIVTGQLYGKWESSLLFQRKAIIDKAFESLLSKEITHYFDPTLSPTFTAYRKNHSYETTLVRLIEGWKHANDRKELVTILSRDISKAFDSLCSQFSHKKAQSIWVH